MPLAHFERDGKPVDYAAARAYFQKNPAQQWAAYVAGVFLVLMRECGVSFSEGAHILISSEVPEGKGVSSSAALEVAVMQAVMAAFDISLDARQVALLCQKVENLVVGAPCGVMDQMTASCGEANRLLALFCQPAELQAMVTIPEQIALWGLDSGVRHSVSGADYGSVRIGAFMGYRIIAQQAGLKVSYNAPHKPVEIDDPRWQGYLANLTPSDFEQSYAHQLPYRMAGASFLRRYGNTTDTVTQLDPTQTYNVRIPTAHPVYEHFRVRTFAELLNSPISERQLELLGELMYQSHASYSACGLGSQGTDKLVQLVRAAGAKQGLYGAKITGGGSGGTVAVLARKGADAAIQAIASKYAQYKRAGERASGRAGDEPHIFRDSSLGAAAFGYLRLKGGGAG